VYLVFVNIGVYLAPVVAGYSSFSPGLPWAYWWCAIFLGTLGGYLGCIIEVERASTENGGIEKD
jgi:hypothetical protein